MQPLKPVEYRLELEPDLDAFTFRGRVTIRGVMEESSDRVALDAADLSFRGCTLDGPRGPEACSLGYEAGAERLSITLPRRVVGPISLTIDYDGVLNDRMAGFYRSRYRWGGEERHIAVSQFEENDARRAFPCQDHPARKAVFDIEMIIDDGLLAVSNQPIVSEVPVRPGKKRVRFARTPPMSTYLVFLAVGAFEAITDAVDGRVRALSVPGLIDHAAYALDFGRRSLQYCETCFRTPYPLAKLDLIAVPDFAFGAMENWGAITFRENLMLHYPGITSQAEEQRICEVVAHEIARQWFGDLVSPAEWKYLWLNESFATLFGYRVVDEAHPDWGVWEQFLGGSTEGALGRDALRDTPAIEIKGSDPVVISASNAPILYSKGAAVLRQVQGYIGDEAFRGGLARYLTDHAFSAAVSTDLWRAFEREVSGLQRPITEMMESWVGQPGHPIVTVESSGGGLALSQARFTYLPADYTQRWVIPVRVLLLQSDGRGRVAETLLSTESGRIELDGEPWAYKLNAGQTGFYRARYGEDENLARLERLARERKLGVEDRWGLQNDLFALVRSGEIGIGRYLEHVEACAEEDAYLTTGSITSNLVHALLVTGEQAGAPIAATGKALLQRVFGRIGLEPRPGEPVLTGLLRRRVMLSAAMLGVAEVVAFGRDRLHAALAGDGVPADLRPAVMEVAAWAGDPGVMQRLLDHHRSAPSEQDRLNVMHALACLPRREQLEEVLDFALRELPARNKYALVAGVATNPNATAWIWPWYRSRLGELEKLHRMHQERVIGAVVPLGGMGFADEVEGFAREYAEKHPELADVIRLSLERLEINLRMRGRPAAAARRVG